MTATKAAGPLAVLEAAFRIIPGKETPFLAYQATVVPLAAAQPGFRAAYSGPVRDTTWVYFGARFDSEEQMNAWHGEARHRVIQKSAPNWWTALYLRKWRPPMPGEVLGDRLMSETSIRVDAALNDTQIKSVWQALAELGAAGAQPFETLTGEFEAHPFQFSGPLLVAPADDKVPYLVTTHLVFPGSFQCMEILRLVSCIAKSGRCVVERALRANRRDAPARTPAGRQAATGLGMDA